MSHPFTASIDAEQAFREAHPQWGGIAPLLTMGGFEGCSATGASLAQNPLPMVHAAYSEIADRQLMVLGERLRHALSVGDIAKLDDETLTHLRSLQIKIAIGGSPCQAFSTAGDQDGLLDERGQLTPLWARLQDDMETPVTVWENVCGALSEPSNGFGHLVGILAGHLASEIDWSPLKEDPRFARLLADEPEIAEWMDANPGAAAMLLDDAEFNARRGYTVKNLTNLLKKAKESGSMSRDARMTLEAGDRGAFLDALVAAPAGAALGMLKEFEAYAPARHELEPPGKQSKSGALPKSRKWPNVGVVVGPKRTVAWRVLDAIAYVPQRRRRVYLVAAVHGSGIDPTEALFDF